jgi:hypothetical protein
VVSTAGVTDIRLLSTFDASFDETTIPDELQEMLGGADFLILSATLGMVACEWTGFRESTLPILGCIVLQPMLDDNSELLSLTTPFHFRYGVNPSDASIISFTRTVMSSEGAEITPLDGDLGRVISAPNCERFSMLLTLHLVETATIGRVLDCATELEMETNSLEELDTSTKPPC